MGRTKRILLIDTSSVLHAVKFGGPKKLKTKEKSTFIIFGFMMKLRALMKRTYSDTVVFACDSKREDSLRKKRYPDYKGNRNKADKTEEQIALDKIALPQFDEVVEDVVPALGYSNVFKFKGFEADDIIGKVCKKYKLAEIVIVTSDHDMYQLLTDKVCILHPSTNQYFTKKMFVEKYGIQPKMWKRVKCMAGCDSDNVAGVPGIGELTALKYIKGELNEFCACGKKRTKAFEKLTSRDGLDIINRNKHLVILPFKNTPECKVTEDKVTKKKIKKVAKTYGFKSIKSDLDGWGRALRAW